MPGCAGCGGADRRNFLLKVAGILAGILVSVRASSAEAASLPVTFGRSMGRHGGEVTYPIPEGDGAMIDLEQEVILVRWQSSVFAFNLSCPHQNTALKWLARDHLFRCPRHKSEYQPDGVFIRGRATRGMDRFAVRKSGDAVIVNLDALYRDDREHEAWTAASVPV
jgi:Rieske Fe-S protein